MSKFTLLLNQSTKPEREERLKSALSTDWEIHTADFRKEPERTADLANQVDVVMGSRCPEFRAGAKLRLYQIPFTGYDWVTPDRVPEGAVFCNTHEHEVTIAEHILAGMLEMQTGLMSDSHPVMKAKSWNGRAIGGGPYHREMFGATVGIVGYGRIGREVARRCKAFGMRVLATSRTIRDEPDLVDWYGSYADLPKLLGESDFVIVCAPLSEETRGLLGAAQFKAMKPDAVVANVGRGEVIDETALYEALASKRIRGGIIDVWYTYPSDGDPNPWPSRFAFQKLDNVIMSPHNSAWTEAMVDRRWNFVATNLDRFAKGEELLNVCFVGTKPR